MLKVPGARNLFLKHIFPLKNHWIFIFLENQIFTALKMQLCVAARAYSAAKKIDPNSDVSKLFGVAITATLSTTYEKGGTDSYCLTD